VKIKVLYILSVKHCVINDTKDEKYSSPFLDFDTRREKLASGLAALSQAHSAWAVWSREDKVSGPCARQEGI